MLKDVLSWPTTRNSFSLFLHLIRQSQKRNDGCWGSLEMTQNAAAFAASSACQCRAWDGALRRWWRWWGWAVVSICSMLVLLESWHVLTTTWTITYDKHERLGIQDGEVRPEPGDLRDIALRWRFHRVQICNIPYFGKTYHSNWSVQVWCRDTRNPVCFLLSYQREQMLFGQNHVHFLCGDIRQRKLGSNLPSFR